MQPFDTQVGSPHASRAQELVAGSMAGILAQHAAELAQAQGAADVIAAAARDQVAVAIAEVTRETLLRERADEQLHRWLTVAPTHHDAIRRASSKSDASRRVLSCDTKQVVCPHTCSLAASSNAVSERSAIIDYGRKVDIANMVEQHSDTCWAVGALAGAHHVVERHATKRLAFNAWHGWAAWRTGRRRLAARAAMQLALRRLQGLPLKRWSLWAMASRRRKVGSAFVRT